MTAMSVAVEALDRLQPAAASHGRVMVLEVMGRDAGHIAIYADIAGGADTNPVARRTGQRSGGSGGRRAHGRMAVGSCWRTRPTEAGWEVLAPGSDANWSTLRKPISGSRRLATYSVTDPRNHATVSSPRLLAFMRSIPWRQRVTIRWWHGVIGGWSWFHWLTLCQKSDS